MSDSDIDIGARWGPNLDKELEETHFGILCLTPECLESPWIHYEAGALSKFVDKAHVCPYLLGLEPSDVKGPFVNFQAAEANKTGTLKLVSRQSSRVVKFMMYYFHNQPRRIGYEEVHCCTF
jgi:hypothetical protein